MSSFDFSGDQYYNIAMQRYKIPSNFNVSSRIPLDSEYLDADFFELIVSSLSEQAFSKADFEKFPVDIILNYLRKTHQLYLWKKLPEIEQAISTISKHFEQSHPSIAIIDIFFRDYREKLTTHIEHEEAELFPYIEILADFEKNGSVQAEQLSKLKKYDLRKFITEHTNTEDDIEEVLRAIRLYKPTQSNESPYRIILTHLKLFELDLNLHARIEEEVLIPKCIKLEEVMNWSLQLMHQRN